MRQNCDVPALMKHPSCAFLCGLLGVLLCGCVLSTEPIGDPDHGADLSDWEGIWVHEEAFDIEAIVAVLRVSGTDDARLDISWLEPGDDEVQLKKGTGVLTRLEGTLFLNVQEIRDDGQRSGRYFWAAIEKDEDVVLARLPAYQELKSLINAGVLSGTIDEDEDEITLDKLTKDEAALISSHRFPTEPVIFRRIGR